MDLVGLCKQNPNAANIGRSHHTRDSKGVPEEEITPSPPHSSVLDLGPYLTREDVALAHCMPKK